MEASADAPIRPADDATYHDPDDDRDLPLFRVENLPAADAMAEWRKTQTTWACRIDGPFAVESKEGTLVCSDGWLALDSEGDPYPIAESVFAATYEPVIAEELAEIADAATTVNEPEPFDPVSLGEVPGERASADEPVDPDLPARLDASQSGLLDQVAHRATYLEIVVSELLSQLTDQGILAEDYMLRATRSADERLRDLRQRATTPGRAGLIAVDLRVVSE